MFQKKIDEIFSSIPNVFSITDILIAGLDEQGKCNDETLERYSNYTDRQT